MNLVRYLDTRSRPILVAAAVVLDLLVGYFDYVTGYEVGLSIFYLLPIGIMAWYQGSGAGLTMSVLAIVTMTVSNVIASTLPLSPWLEFWNGLVHFGSFVIVAVLLSMLRQSVAERDTLISELKATLQEVKTLSGLLPICAWCKNIRDDRGYWKEVEQYVSDHTDARFTHGICPKCLRTVSPEAYAKLEKKQEGTGETAERAS